MYEQPRVPQFQGNVVGYLKTLALFLKGHLLDVWKAVSTMKKQIDALSARLDELEGK